MLGVKIVDLITHFDKVSDPPQIGSYHRIALLVICRWNYNAPTLLNHYRFIPYILFFTSVGKLVSNLNWRRLPFSVAVKIAYPTFSENGYAAP